MLTEEIIVAALDALLTIQEAAVELGVTRPRIEQEVMQGKLRTIRRNGRHWILRSEFEEYCRQRRPVGRPVGYSPKHVSAIERTQQGIAS